MISLGTAKEGSISIRFANEKWLDSIVNTEENWDTVSEDLDVAEMIQKSVMQKARVSVCNMTFVIQKYLKIKRKGAQ